MSDVSAVLAAGDAAATRTVYATVIALAAIGLLLLVLAIWLIKQTKPEPELLAPLERMDDRSWRQQDPTEARRDLDRLRPAGARPVAKAKGVPNVDSQFGASSPLLGSFEDLDADFVHADDADVSNGLPRLVDHDEARPSIGLDPLLRFDPAHDDSPTSARTGALERPSVLPHALENAGAVDVPVDEGAELQSDASD